MKKSFLSLIASYKLMTLLLFVYAVAIANATFIESFKDTISARVLVYNAPWFIALQLLMVVNFIAIAAKQNLLKQKKYGTLLLHLGFVVILCGALTTHLFGTEGIMAIREGEKSSFMLSSDAYFKAVLRKGGKEISEIKKVNYGALTESNFSIELEGLTSAPVIIDYDSYAGDQNSGSINIDVRSGSTEQRMSIEGGKYQFQSPMVIDIEDAELFLTYGSEIVDLPFSIKLKDFELERYPGSSSPSSFSSDVVIDHKGSKRPYRIYMNNIAYIGSYRVYQTSYDNDEKGTILTVNHDLIGTIISYIGYLMLAFGMILSLFHKGSRFSQLSRRIKEISAVAVLLFAANNANAQVSQADLEREAINIEIADKFSELLVQNPNGRIEPINSYAQKLLLKLHHSSDFNGLSPEQVLLGIISSPYEWSHAKMIYVGNEQLRNELNGNKSKYVSFTELFDSKGGYILSQKVDSVHSTSSMSQNKYQKEIIKLDEKANILNSLFDGLMLSIFPIKGDPNSRWISMGDDLSLLPNAQDSLLVTKIIPWLISESDNVEQSKKIVDMIHTYQGAMADADHLIPEKKVKYEIFYNKTNIFKQSGLAYLILGSIILIILLTSLLKGSESRFASKTVTILSALLLAAFLWQSFGIALRWYISGRAPWTNSFESMIYVGWSAIFTGIIFMRRSKVTLAISALMAGAIMMISQLSLLDPEITPLVPVLKSYWLMFHVATITASYGFFGVAALIGLSVMIIYTFSEKDKLKLKIEELTIINEMTITLGLILLTVGIFIGAVWANESWGRYWGWDPKESWALISMLVYTFVLHARFMPKMRSHYIFNLMSIIAFYSVLMTFFGVNYFLSGMHSYGKVDSFSPMAVAIPTAAIIILSILAARKK